MDIGGAGSVTTNAGYRAELAHLLSALELMPVATVIVSSDGRAMAVNQAWCELTGLSEQESRGAGWGKVLRMEDRHQLVGALGDLAASGGAAGAECQLQLDGRSCRTRWFLRARDVGANRLAIVTVVETAGIGSLTDQVGWLAAQFRDLAAIDTSHAAALLDASHNLYRAFVTLAPESRSMPETSRVFA